jgi:eRF1 domain 1
MRIIKKGIAHRNGEGFVRLQPDESEDMYHLFNLICEGDIIRADTIRNVTAFSVLFNAFHIRNSRYALPNLRSKTVNPQLIRVLLHNDRRL